MNGDLPNKNLPLLRKKSPPAPRQALDRRRTTRGPGAGGPAAARARDIGVERMRRISRSATARRYILSSLVSRRSSRAAHTADAGRRSRCGVASRARAHTSLRSPRAGARRSRVNRALLVAPASGSHSLRLSTRVSVPIPSAGWILGRCLCAQVHVQGLEVRRAMIT